MKNKNESLIIVLIVLTLVGTGIGCRTVDLGPLNTEGEKLARMASLSRVISFVAVSTRLQNKPENAREFTLAKTAIELLFLEEKFDVESLREALVSIPDGKLVNDKAGLIIMTVALLFTDTAGNPIGIQTPAEVKAVAGGLRDGIDMALRMYGPNTVQPASVVVPVPAMGKTTVIYKDANDKLNIVNQ